MRKTLRSDKALKMQSQLIAARATAGLTQVELSQKLKKPQSFVSYYENGGRRLDVVEFIEICTVLGADPAKIIKQLQDK